MNPNISTVLYEHNKLLESQYPVLMANNVSTLALPTSHPHSHLLSSPIHLSYYHFEANKYFSMYFQKKRKHTHYLIIHKHLAKVF